jgi:hypothetical protein
MHKYCKAYQLKDLRQFNSWTEKRAEDEQALSDDSVCYLWDDFTVVKSPVQDKGVIFDAITPEWKEFCAATLKFEIPEDLRYAYQNDEKQSVEQTEAQKEATV